MATGDPAGAASGRDVDLGFVVEDTPSWKLESRFFPSKIGGKPAWLALGKPPTREQLSCRACGKPLTFLLQIYAPLDIGGDGEGGDSKSGDESNNDGFHRSLFVFLCKNPACLPPGPGANVAVFRSQLSRDNAYYPRDPPDEEDPTPTPGARLSDRRPVCWVCGVAADGKRCAACKVAAYCSQDHQRADWRAGHREGCGKEAEPPSNRMMAKPVLFPEKEIEIGGEELNDAADADSDDGEDGSVAESNGLDADIDEKIKGLTVGSAQFSETELMAMARNEEDPVCERFLSRVRKNPSQILRYQRGGKPLWVSKDNRPDLSKDVPHCSLCGGRRQLEFQIMPQLLTHLDLDEKGESLDWGTIAVFTCKNSCKPDEYAPEFAWKQDFAPN